MSDELSEAAKFADLEPRSFVRISGFGDSPTDWHVNKNFTIGLGDDPLLTILGQFLPDDADLDEDSIITHGIVLQRADASEEWLSVVVTEDNESIDITHVAHMKAADERPETLDDTDLSVLDTSSTKINLGDSDE